MRSDDEILEEITPFLQVGVKPNIACGLVKISLLEFQEILNRKGESLSDCLERCKEEGKAYVLVTQYALAVNQKNTAMLKHLGEVMCGQKTNTDNKGQLQIPFAAPQKVIFEKYDNA